MADINTALEASKDATEQLIIAGERTGTAWNSPRAPGKWSPSQIAEHVARSLEESANVAAGRPSRVTMPPAVIQPLLRFMFFNRILRTAVFPKGYKAHKTMNPASGPATPAEGRARLETAHQQLDGACRQLAARGERMRTAFGAVPVEDFVRFMELHTRHHGKQMSDG
jgi:hypothetical protein